LSGKCFGFRRQHRAARKVDLIATLLAGGQAGGHAVAIGQQEAGEVDQVAAAVAGEYVASPEHGTGKRFLDGGAFILVGGGCDVARVVLHEEQPGAVLFEMDHAHLAGLAAIETNVVRA
jgi:hypothetical protein